MMLLRVMAGLMAHMPRKMIAIVLMLMILASATESFGVLLLVPFLAKLEGISTSHSFDALTLQWISLMGVPLSLAGILSIFVLLVVIKTCLSFARDHWSSRLQLLVIDNARRACLKSLLEAEWRWLAFRRSSDLSNLVLIEVVRLGVGAHGTLLLIAGSLTTLAYLSVAFIISFGMTLMALATAAFLFFLLSNFHRQAHALGQLQSDRNRSLFQTVQSSLAALKIARVHANEAKYLDLLDATVIDAQRAQLQAVWNSALTRSIFQVAGAIFLALYVYIGWTVLHLSAPELLTLVFIFGRLMPIMNSVQQQMHSCLSVLPALLEVEQFLAESQKASAPSAKGTEAPLPLDREIELRNVSLSYEKDARPILDQISVTLPARKVIALMGPSGAGKTTLADVIMGLTVPNAGQLLVDDVPVSGTNRRRWMQAIGYMPQDSLIFPGTVRENLCWFAPDVDDATIQEALTSASAQFVFNLPNGLETLLGAGGIELSGGESQRISLARALLQKPSFLVLDEPTSALDDGNTGRIFETIKLMRGTVTILLIGHSHMAAEIADLVVTLREGRMVSISRRAQDRAFGDYAN